MKWQNKKNFEDWVPRKMSIVYRKAGSRVGKVAYQRACLVGAADFPSGSEPWYPEHQGRWCNWSWWARVDSLVFEALILLNELVCFIAQVNALFWTAPWIFLFSPIGNWTAWGSGIEWAKYQGIMTHLNPQHLPSHQLLPPQPSNSTALPILVLFTFVIHFFKFNPSLLFVSCPQIIQY